MHLNIADASNFAAYIRRGVLGGMLHGSHLLHLWIIHQIHYQIIVPIAPRVEAVTTAQAVDSVLAGLAVGVFYLTARTIIRDRILSVLLAFVLAFSYYFWIFASDVEVLAPAILFYLLSLLVTLRLPEDPPVWHIVVIAVFTAGSILSHLVTGLTGIVISTLILLRQDDEEHKTLRVSADQVKQVLVYVLATGLIVIAAYAYVIIRVYQYQTATEIINWIAQFLPDDAHAGFSTTASLPDALRLAPTGIARSLIGLLAWFATPGLDDVMAQALSSKDLREELYAVRNLPALVATTLTVLGILAGILFSLLSLISLSGLVEAAKRRSRYLIVIYQGGIDSNPYAFTHNRRMLRSLLRG
jgi:hypothetical protein